MTSQEYDPRMTRIQPRIRYNTVGGVNGPLVILDNVCLVELLARGAWLKNAATGQISQVQRDRLAHVTRWLGAIRTGVGSKR